MAMHTMAPLTMAITYYGYNLLWLYLLWLYLQELIDCFSMREAAAAQLALLRDQPEV